MAAFEGERDIALGNVVGSNIFNVLVVIGLSALVSPAGLNAPPTLVHFDIPVMIAVCAACLPIFFSGYCINRWEGALFFAYHLLYTAYLLLAATHHDALDTFSFAVGGFVLPLTAVTLAVIGRIGGPTVSRVAGGLKPGFGFAGGYRENGQGAIGGRNLALWTDYSGFDPEAISNNAAEDVAAFGQYEFFNLPPSKRFFVRLTVDF